MTLNFLLHFVSKPFLYSRSEVWDVLLTKFVGISSQNSISTFSWINEACQIHIMVQNRNHELSNIATDTFGHLCHCFKAIFQTQNVTIKINSGYYLSHKHLYDKTR